MAQIVVVDYELVGAGGDPKIYQLLDGGDLEAALNRHPFALFSLSPSMSAAPAARGVCAFEIDPMITPSQVIGRIHTAIQTALGPRTQMNPSLPSRYVRLYVSAGDSQPNPVTYVWDQTVEKMI